MSWQKSTAQTTDREMQEGAVAGDIRQMLQQVFNNLQALFLLHRQVQQQRCHH
jgi:hypothetical protein